MSTTVGLSDLLRQLGVVYSAKYIGVASESELMPGGGLWNASFCSKKGTACFSYYQGKAIRCEPSAEDVLYCLCSDIAASSQPFQAWAREFGYNDASIKARQIYDACILNTKKLERIFSADEIEQIGVLLQDY